MNTFSALFGIFRQRGLVTLLQENRSLNKFFGSAFLLSLCGGMLYGAAMGIGYGLETALKDALKFGLMVVIGLAISIPIFWLAYRLLGREESFAQVASVPLAFVTTAAVVLAVTSPIVFLLSLLSGFSPEAIYIHIVLVDLALLLGLYLAGTLVFHSFANERSRLVAPNVTGFLMLGVTLVVMVQFFSPFMSLSSTFSLGTDLLKDRLGIGVGEKAAQALQAAARLERLTYDFMVTDAAGSQDRIYTITRLGSDYLVEVHLHNRSDGTPLVQRHIWILDGKIFTDLVSGKVQRTSSEEVEELLADALPAAVFSLPDSFTQAAWRGYTTAGIYTASVTNQSREQVLLEMDAKSLRLRTLKLGRLGQPALQALTIQGLRTPTINRTGLETHLNQAVLLGSRRRVEASMQEFIQSDTFFSVSYPDTWRSGEWDAVKRKVTLRESCSSFNRCPSLTVSVYDLEGALDGAAYADRLASSLELQSNYSQVQTGLTSLDGKQLSYVEYLFPNSVHHIEYIFVGSHYYYHLHFSAVESQFAAQRPLFESLAERFVYLQGLP